MKVIFSNLKEYEQRFQIKFLKPKISKHTNGFISVQLDWTNAGNAEFFKFKRVDIAHSSYGGYVAPVKRKNYNVVTASFEFPELEKLIEETNKSKEQYITPWISISLTTAKKNAFKEGYEYNYEFFNNTKYGLICWFTPKNWEDWRNTTKL
jgi:hypothetical protein